MLEMPENGQKQQHMTEMTNNGCKLFKWLLIAVNGLTWMKIIVHGCGWHYISETC